MANNRYAFRLAFWFSALLALLSACSGGDKRDIREYYFPLSALRSGVVYEYDLVGIDSSAPEYWYYRSFLRDSGQFLVGTFYDSRFEIGQIVREKIVRNGAQAREYHLYQPDTSGQQTPIPTRIESPDVFPFEVKDSNSVYLFSLNFHPPEDPDATIYVIRNRQFMGDARPFEFQGESYPCVRFRVREAIGNKKDGAAEVEGIGEEWYARGLGLVYFSKSYGSDFRFAYRLVDTIGMPELERRAAAR